MDDKKNWGSTVLGWFVVREDGASDLMPQPDAADAYTRAADAPVAPPQAAVEFLTAPPAAPGGKVDFPAVYAAAGIDDEEQARVEKAAGLLRSLPEGTDPAVKKQIVEASLKAFSVEIEKIIEAGVQEIQ